MHDEGYTWAVGEALTEYTHWENYSSNTCYSVRTAYKQKLVYCSINDWDEKINNLNKLNLRGKDYE